jgi:hypothetical protein
LNVVGLDGLAGCDGEVGEMAGSEPIRIGRLDGSGGEVGSAGLVLIDVGGGFRGDFDVDRNMLSVVVARVTDRGWKGSEIEKDFDGRASGVDVVGEIDEKAEGDIGGLALLGIVAYWLLSDARGGELIGCGSDGSSDCLVEAIAESGL